MAFQREKQDVSASELLQALADGEDIQLSGCTVSGVLDLNRLFDPAERFNTERLRLKQDELRRSIRLSQSIVFDKCVFEENVVFSGPWSEPDSITVEFEKDVIFNSSTFKAQTRFRSAFFHGTAGFDGCRFGGVVTFKNAVFRGDAKFRTVVIDGYLLLGGAVFHSSARFASTHFVKGANFSQVRFLGAADFGGVYSSSRAVPVYDAIYFARRRFGEDESFWRFVKQSATEAGYYQLAGECFYSERCANLWQKLYRPGYDTLSISGKLWRLFLGLRLLPELVFGKLLFGYGERPVRVLIASAVIIAFCGLLFSQPDALLFREGSTTPTFLQGLYFSTITFTTLGYGDLYPNPERYYRQLAMAEAVAGGCLMALFVVCLAKRFSRG
jgi:hypothetical protein